MVVGIIAVLAVISTTVAAAVQRKGAMTRELNAGRQIMLAYNSYSTDHDGALLKGYDKGVGEVFLPSGKTVTGIMCARYPWRLAPYAGEAIDDIFLINDTRRQTDRLETDSFSYQYLASLYPSFGINGYCVGGYDDSTGSGNFASDCVTRAASAVRPSTLIVFVSARYRESPEKADTPGFHIVTPPKLWRTKWTTPFDQKKTPSAFGNVNPRWDGRAICAFLDGHVAMLGQEELTDMRFWSNTAAETNDRNFTVPR